MNQQFITPGAERAARVRSAGERHHANAVCVFEGSDPFGVIFDRTPKDSLGFVGGRALACSFSISKAPGLIQGGKLVIDGVAFEVVEPVEPDASGWVKLQLRELEAEAVNG